MLGVWDRGWPRRSRGRASVPHTPPLLLGQSRDRPPAALPSSTDGPHNGRSHWIRSSVAGVDRGPPRRTAPVEQTRSRRLICARGPVTPDMAVTPARLRSPRPRAGSQLLPHGSFFGEAAITSSPTPARPTMLPDTNGHADSSVTAPTVGTTTCADGRYCSTPAAAVQVRWLLRPMSSHAAGGERAIAPGRQQWRGVGPAPVCVTLGVGCRRRFSLFERGFSTLERRES